MLKIRFHWIQEINKNLVGMRSESGAEVLKFLVKYILMQINAN